MNRMSGGLAVAGIVFMGVAIGAIGAARGRQEAVVESVGTITTSYGFSHYYPYAITTGGRTLGVELMGECGRTFLRAQVAFGVPRYSAVELKRLFDAAWDACPELRVP